MSGADAPGRGEIAVDVAIVGAGPAGLTTGYLLAKAGKRVAIIEKDPAQVGGIGRTIELEGHRFSIGGHELPSKNQAVVDLWNEILPDDLIRSPLRTRIYFEGKFYSYPLRAVDALHNLGLLRSAACLASYTWARLFPIKDASSFTDWASNRFGRKLYSLFFEPYVEKVWGLPGNRISADWAAQRLEHLSLWSASPEDINRPRLGPGMMWEAARDRIVELGGIVLMGHTLKQLASDGQGGWRMTATGPDGEVMITAGHAISSVPMRELAARLYPLPTSMIEASRLKYRDRLTVALTIRADDGLSDSCIYVHDSKVQAGRVRGFRAWSPEAAPDERVSCIGFEYFCGEGAGLWSMPDDRLVELARREMDILGLVSPGKMIGGTVVRHEKACPVYDEGYGANVSTMRREIGDTHPTLHLVGRTGTHSCAGGGEAMMSAMLTVENILAGQNLYDTWRVNEHADVTFAEAHDAQMNSPELAFKNEVPQHLPTGSEPSAPRKKVA